MQHIPSNTNPVSVDHSPTATAIPAYSPATLRLLSTGDTDFVDAALRAILILCLVASLTICGLRSGATRDAGETTSPLLPTWSQVGPHVPALPALPTVKLCTASR